MARDSSIKLIEIPELFFPIFFCFASYKFALSPKVETRKRDMNFNEIGNTLQMAPHLDELCGVVLTLISYDPNFYDSGDAQDFPIMLSHPAQFYYGITTK